VSGLFFLLSIVVSFTNGFSLKISDFIILVYSALAFIFLAKFEYRFLPIAIVVGLIFGIGLLRNVVLILMQIPTTHVELTREGLVEVSFIPLFGAIFYFYQVFFFSKKEVRNIYKSIRSESQTNLTVPHP
jgi:hypothetical protein